MVHIKWCGVYSRGSFQATLLDTAKFGLNDKDIYAPVSGSVIHSGFNSKWLTSARKMCDLSWKSASLDGSTIHWYYSMVRQKHKVPIMVLYSDSPLQFSLVYTGKRSRTVLQDNIAIAGRDGSAEKLHFIFCLILQFCPVNDSKLLWCFKRNPLRKINLYYGLYHCKLPCNAISVGKSWIYKLLGFSNYIFTENIFQNWYICRLVLRSHVSSSAGSPKTSSQTIKYIYLFHHSVKWPGS